MKNLHFLFTLSIICILMSCNTSSKKQSAEEKTTTNQNPHIEVIDFHSTNRCMTCNTIESNTKYTLETYFTEELENKKIIFSIVNIDEKENFAKAEKFEASGTSLFLHMVKPKGEEIVNLTNFAFSNARDQEKFSNGLKEKIEQAITKL